MNMQPEDPARQLGPWMSIALVIGSMIGTAIFMLPANLAPFGINTVYSWVISGVGAVFLALIFSALGRAFPDAEGPYAYTRMAFGDLVAFIVAWGYWVSLWVFNAAIATGATAYLGSLLPWVSGSTTASAITTLSFLWILTAVNIIGVRTAGGVQVATTALKLIPLVAVVGLLGWLLLKRSPMVVQSELLQTSFRMDSLTSAATLTLAAMVGLESASVMSKRVRNPERNVPLATLVGTIITAFIYITTCTTVMLLIPAAQLVDSSAPFSDLARIAWGDAAAYWISLFVVISALGCLNAGILMQGELPLHMARNGSFPAVFARESRRGTPVASLCIGSVLATLLVLLNFQKSMVDIYSFMLLLATTATLVLYLMCSLAVLVLLRRGKLPAYRRGSTGLALVGIVAALFSLWSFVGAGKEAVIYGVVLLAAAVPVFFLMRRMRVAAESS